MRAFQAVCAGNYSCYRLGINLGSWAVEDFKFRGFDLSSMIKNVGWCVRQRFQRRILEEYGNNVIIYGSGPHWHILVYF